MLIRGQSGGQLIRAAASLPIKLQEVSRKDGGFHRKASEADSLLIRTAEVSGGDRD